MTKPLLTQRSPSGRIGLAILCAAGAPFLFVNPGTAAGAGFLVGALPLLLFEASLSPGFAFGDHPSLTRGLLTIGGLVVDLRGPAFLGAFGATGGFAFWLALKLTVRSTSLLLTPDAGARSLARFGASGAGYDWRLLCTLRARNPT